MSNEQNNQNLLASKLRDCCKNTSIWFRVLSCSNTKETYRDCSTSLRKRLLRIMSIIFLEFEFASKREVVYIHFRITSSYIEIGLAFGLLVTSLTATNPS